MRCRIIAQKQDLLEIVNMGIAPYEVALQYYVAFGYDKVKANWFC